MTYRGVFGLGLALAAMATSCGDSDSNTPPPGGAGGTSGGSIGGLGGASGVGARSGAGGTAGSAGTPAAGTAGDASAGAGAGGTDGGSAGSSGEGGAGAAGGPSAGAGGSSAGAGGDDGAGGAGTCGDGVLTAGEACCTDVWVEERIEALVASVAAQAVGTTTCVPRTPQTGLDLCNSMACQGGAVGCNSEIVAATVDYEPGTRVVEGDADVEVTGQLTAFGVLTCTFTAFVDATYTADVVAETTPEELSIEVTDIVLDYTLDLEGCPGGAALETQVRSAADAALRPVIEQQIAALFRRTEACPY